MTLVAINPDTINDEGASGYLPLTLACYHGNKEVALFLASRVKDINANGKQGTPLMAAVFKNDIAIVETLLKHHADPNIADGNGTTALHYAILSRNEAIIKLLVQANADVSFKDARGNSALDYGEMTKNKTIIELLKKNKI